MEKLKLFAAILVASLFLCGCATVKIYSDAEMKSETGLRYYTLKPYLLVEYQSVKDNTIKSTVVYLPDLSSPQYIRLKPGLGATNAKLTFTNSALASYGAEIDSQLPKAMDAFAAVLSKSAYAYQGFTGPGPLGPDEQQLPVAGDDLRNAFRLFEIIISTEGTILKEVEP